MNFKFSLSLIAVLVLFNSCTGCVKSVAKKVTESGVAAIDGVNEALDENAERIGEATTSVAIKVLKGAGKSLEKELDIHAKYIEEQNGQLTLTNIDSIDVKQLSNFYQKISFEQDAANGVSVKFVGKLESSPVLDTYISFSKTDNYNCDISLLHNGDTIMSKNMDVLIDSIPQIKLISFYTNKLDNVHPDDYHIVVRVANN